ncbi:MAG: flavin monoamine oxidase family protein [Terriglobales bacterium]
MPEAVVIGAGAAGLAAFHDLRAAGCDALLVDARDRVGGRIWTLHPENWPAPVELGAEFVHSELPGLELAPSPPEGADWSEHDGRVLPAEEAHEDADVVLERLPLVHGHDMSFAAFLQQYCHDLPPEARESAVAFIEGYEAADASRISVLSLQREFAASQRGAGWPLRPRGGYAQLLHQLHSDGEIWLEAPVWKVNWKKHAVQLPIEHRGAKRDVQARAAIVTLPLSVLQNGSVSFDPPLAAKSAALGSLSMGGALRVVMRLHTRFWEAVRDSQGNPLGRLRFLFSQTPGHFPVWWTHPDVPQITGWAAGPHAAALKGLTPRLLTRWAARELAAHLGTDVEMVEAALIEAHTHDWQADPWSQGAYSYACVGGAGAHAALAQPLEQTLFFAGEATDSSGRHATVTGAVVSGRRAAAEVLAAI